MALRRPRGSGLRPSWGAERWWAPLAPGTEAACCWMGLGWLSLRIRHGVVVDFSLHDVRPAGDAAGWPLARRLPRKEAYADAS
mmetsp:Transcript_108447/g.336996  ORF Transcript_108447/g.336996 Transcript_108447/m.336996 type:complete len:83 (+) Transcript_108447:11-259(+)